MSFRIHKVLGYGLSDLKVKGLEIVDPRINVNSPLLNEDALEEQYGDTKNALESYKEWLVENRGGRIGGMDSARTIDKFIENDIVHFWNLVTFQPEFGKKQVLCVTPLSCFKGSNWYRRDEIIDYVEAGFLKNPTKPRLEVLSDGLYPYIGSYVDKRTGEKVSQEIMWWVRLKNDTKGSPKKIERQLGTLNMYAEAAGFKSHAEALENVIPEPAKDVVSLARWGKLFTDDKHILDLRPMLYTYWS